MAIRTTQLRIVCALFAWLLFICSQASADSLLQELPRQQKSIALVVGNGSYSGRPLPNAGNDAGAVASKLRSMGFEVYEYRDASLRVLSAAVAAFALEAKAVDVALVYFAGHGIQLEGKNYLIPVDTAPTYTLNLGARLYPVNQLVSQLQGDAAHTTVIVLDACRSLADAGASISPRLGLAPPESDGTYMAFSADYGRVAFDGEAGSTGPYATALVRHLATPGLALSELFQKVRTDVEAATSGEQSPREVSGLKGYSVPRLVPGGPDGGAQPSVAQVARRPSLAAEIGVFEVGDRFDELRIRVSNASYRFNGDEIAEVAELLNLLPRPTHQAAMMLLTPTLPALDAQQLVRILKAVDPLAVTAAFSYVFYGGKVLREFTPAEVVDIVVGVPYAQRRGIFGVLQERQRFVLSAAQIQSILSGVDPRSWRDLVRVIIRERELTPTEGVVILRTLPDATIAGERLSRSRSVLDAVRGSLSSTQLREALGIVLRGSTDRVEVAARFLAGVSAAGQFPLQISVEEQNEVLADLPDDFRSQLRDRGIPWLPRAVDLR